MRRSEVSRIRRMPASGVTSSRRTGRSSAVRRVHPWRRQGSGMTRDWLFRFGLNPQDFVPHSGEFLADATEPQLRAVIGFSWCRGEGLSNITNRGRRPSSVWPAWIAGKCSTKNIVRNATGDRQGDGPAASGLNPKPAVHANIPFEKLPTDYLYNVINRGGAAMGKSPNMPYWGLTIGQQGVADVMAYLKATFKGGPDQAQASVGGGASGVCPQPRKTAKAPPEFLSKTNPLPSSDAMIQGGEDTLSADGTAGGLRHVPWRERQRPGLHGRGVDSTASQLYLRLDDEGLARWATVLDHQKRVARNRHDVVCRIAG